jgi:hypothetical protein
MLVQKLSERWVFYNKNYRYIKSGLRNRKIWRRRRFQFRHFIWLWFRFQLRFRVIYMHIHIHIHICICVCLRKHIHVHILNIYIYSTYTYSLHIHVQIPILVPIHACTHTYLNMYTYMCTYSWKRNYSTVNKFFEFFASFPCTRNRNCIPNMVPVPVPESPNEYGSDRFRLRNPAKSSQQNYRWMFKRIGNAKREQSIFVGRYLRSVLADPAHFGPNPDTAFRERWLWITTGSE